MARELGDGDARRCHLEGAQVSRLRWRSALSPIAIMALAPAPACGGRTAPVDEVAQPSPSPGDSGSEAETTPEQVVGGIVSPCNVFAAGGRVFWSTSKYPIGVWGCDPANCAGTMSRYAAGSLPPMMAADKSNLYWTSQIGSCPLTGCATPVEENPSPFGNLIAGGLAVDESRIFWTEQGTLRACPKTAWVSYCDELAPEHSTAVVLDDLSIYWIRDGADGSIMRMSKTGNAPEELAVLQNLPTGLFVEAESVFWTTRWAAGSIFQCPKSGCGASPAVILGGLQKPDSLLVDPRKLFWTLTPSTFESEEQDEIHACSRDDCAGTRRMLASTRSLPACKQRLAQDDSYIYWAVDPNTGKPPVANGSIMRVRK